MNVAGPRRDLFDMRRAVGRAAGTPRRWPWGLPMSYLRYAEYAWAGLLLAQAAGLPTVGAAHAAEPVRAVTTAYNASGHDLFAEFAAAPGNIVFSPYSIGTAMAMVLAGARGDTEREMATVLRHSLPPEAIDAANARALAVLNGYDRSSVPAACPSPIMHFNGSECEAPVPASGVCPSGYQQEGRCIAPGRVPPSATLKAANALMLLKPNGDMISGAYAARLADKYGAQVFRDADLGEINGWVSRQRAGNARRRLQAHGVDDRAGADHAPARLLRDDRTAGLSRNPPALQRALTRDGDRAARRDRRRRQARPRSRCAGARGAVCRSHAGAKRRPRAAALQDELPRRSRQAVSAGRHASRLRHAARRLLRHDGRAARRGAACHQRRHPSRRHRGGRAGHRGRRRDRGRDGGGEHAVARRALRRRPPVPVLHHGRRDRRDPVRRPHQRSAVPVLSSVTRPRLPRWAMSATRSARPPMPMSARPVSAPASPRAASGRKARPKPSFCASLRRAPLCATGRIAPDSDTSPKNTASGGSGALLSEETSAAAAARSAAGSWMRRPPATLR